MSSANAAAVVRRDADDTWEAPAADIIVGKDILELLSSSMYVDPITVYREYVQNAADAIDDARALGMLAVNEPGTVEIAIGVEDRSIRIRDNGTGISSREFERRLTAFGRSLKRGSSARGFRGVGRLSGLGYCQELICRSRSPGDTKISELRWDCRRLKSALRDATFTGDLSALVREIVTVRRISPNGWPERFFEVELKGVIRHRNDRLLSSSVVAEYLSQVAPVPFASDFRFGPAIEEAICQYADVAHVVISVSGFDGPLVRPHRDLIIGEDDETNAFTDLEVHAIPGNDGEVAALAWVLHHGYTGAIPTKALIKGLRLRCGNLQVGDHTLLEELFPEQRFNAWSVGEIHVIDPRILPNGRRDHFEQSVHFDNLLNHLSPVARDIARRCRTKSVRRKWLRDFQIQEAAARERIKILRQGTLRRANRAQLVLEIERALGIMQKIAALASVSIEAAELHSTLDVIRAELAAASLSTTAAEPLAHLPAKRRAIYQDLFGLIYECSANRIAAKALVDRILLRLSDLPSR